MQIDDNTWFFVSGVLTDLEKQNERFDSATDGLMIAPESPLKEPFARVVDSLLSACSELINDPFDHLSWYVYECDFGMAEKTAGCEGDMRTIDSHDKLRWLIEVECGT